MVPKHKDWLALKKKYSVPAGAVSSVNVGKALDVYWQAPGSTPADQLAILEPLGVKLKAYIEKLDKKKIKQYAAFQKEFLDDYLGEVHKQINDSKRYKATAALYKTELAKFFTAVQALNKATTTKSEIEKFKSGPVRGLSAVGSNARGVDPTEIDKWLATINTAVQSLPSNPSRSEIETFIDATVKTAEAIAKQAKKQKLA